MRQCPQSGGHLSLTCMYTSWTMDEQKVQRIETELEAEVRQRYRWGESRPVIREDLYQRLLLTEDDSEEEEAYMGTLDRMAGWCPPQFRL